MNIGISTDVSLPHVLIDPRNDRRHTNFSTEKLLVLNKADKVELNINLSNDKKYIEVNSSQTYDQ